MKIRSTRIVALIIAITMLLGGVISVSAATEGDGTTLLQRPTQPGKVVDFDSTVAFKLEVYREDDEFVIYQLAEMIWNSTLLAKKGSFENATWVAPLKDWIANDAKYAEHIDFSAYTTPALLGKEGEKDSAAAVTFMSAIQRALENDAAFKTDMESYLVAVKTGATHTEGIDEKTWTLENVDADGQKQDKSFTASVSPAEEGEPATFTKEYAISGLAFGLYMVDPSNTVSQRTYQPLLVDLSPDQTGPSGNWYYGETISASLKYQDLNIRKKIYKGEQTLSALVTTPVNETDLYDYDIVRADEAVNFYIEVQVPQYPKETANKAMYANDIMAAGFTLNVASAYLQYSKDDGLTWAHVDPKNYKLIIASNANIFYAKDKDNKTVEFAFSIANENTESTGNYTTYYLKDGKATQLGFYGTDADAIKAIMNAYNNQMAADKKVSGTVDTKDTTQGTLGIRPYTKSVINADFFYDQLMDSVGQITNLRLGYTAVVNENMEIGTDNNTNVIDFYYVKDSTGTIGYVEDDVVAWTYAAQIIKIDGETVNLDGTPLVDGSGTPQKIDYLKNALFDLYRMTDEYCSGSASTGTEDTDYVNYTWISNHDGFATYEAAGMPEKLDQVTGEVFFHVVDAEPDACPEPHKHIQVFKRIRTNIKSVEDEEGVLVKGLDPDSYILIETNPPSEEFNPLSEGVWFEINQYTEAQAEAAGGTYKGFIGDDRENRIDGIYPIKVLNFKGTILPSTGGIGTLIFTVVGIGIMLLVMTILVMVARRKKGEFEQ